MSCDREVHRTVTLPDGLRVKEVESVFVGHSETQSYFSYYDLETNEPIDRKPYEIEWGGAIEGALSDREAKVATDIHTRIEKKLNEDREERLKGVDFYWRKR